MFLHASYALTSKAPKPLATPLESRDLYDRARALMADSCLSFLEPDPAKVVIAAADRRFVGLDRSLVVGPQLFRSLALHADFVRIEHAHNVHVRFLAASITRHRSTRLNSSHLGISY